MNKGYDNKTIGERIKDLRKKNKMTQVQLANILDLSQNSIAKIENDKATLVLDHQLNLAKYFNVSHDYLITGLSTDSILSLLEQYVSLDYIRHSLGEDTSDIPVLKINEAFFHYLATTSSVKNNKNVPENIKNLWIEQEILSFYKKNVKNNFSSSKEVVPVPPNLIYPDDNKENWKQHDLLRALNKWLTNSSFNVN